MTGLYAGTWSSRDQQFRPPYWRKRMNLSCSKSLSTVSGYLQTHEQKLTLRMKQVKLWCSGLALLHHGLGRSGLTQKNMSSSVQAADGRNPGLRQILKLFALNTHLRKLTVRIIFFFSSVESFIQYNHVIYTIFLSALILFFLLIIHCHNCGCKSRILCVLIFWSSVQTLTMLNAL